MAKKTLDENKILIVVCNKNKELVQHQIDLLKNANLLIPATFSLQIHPIIGSKNLATSFNEVQKKFNAKYKIYLTTPLDYVDRDFICKYLFGIEL